MNVLLLTGGRVSIPFATEYIKDLKYDKVIAVDSGLMYAKELNLSPDYIVGDFDSVDQKVYKEYTSSSAKILQFNPEKDATDTELALDLCLELMAEEVYILGASGSRIDHTLANIHLLYRMLKKNVKTYIIDEWNKVYLMDNQLKLSKDKLHGSYVSLLPFMEVVTGLTLRGFKYPLTNYTMKPYYSLGVSNEMIDDTADIILQTGILIVIEARD
ncbi:MAG: thiamine diphosphokinase [Anaerocolumna sp.]